MTTGLIKVPGSDRSAGSILLEELPFPKTNLLFHASADRVVEEVITGTAAETRVASFIDLNTEALYSVGTAHRIGKREQVNGTYVVRGSLQAGVATVARNYAFPPAFIQGRNSFSLCGITRADPAATGVQTVWGAGANAGNVTSNSSALFDIEYVTPTSLRLRSEAQRDDLALSDVSAVVGGLPDAYVFWVATMNLLKKTLTLTVDRVGQKEIAFPDGVAPSPASLIIRNGPFRHVAPTPTNFVSGNLFTGWAREFAGFTDEIGEVQESHLVSTFRDTTQILNR